MTRLVRFEGQLLAVGAGESGGNLVLDPWNWRWSPFPHRDLGDSGEPLSAEAAITWLHAERRCRLVPVAVVGPRDPAHANVGIARDMGRALGRLGVPIVCGGKSGVMEAASDGAAREGGLVIGMIPDNEWQAANQSVTLPLATGLGPARNILIARSCVAMVAIGGQYGTITEVAYALHFDKPVFGLAGAPDIEGVQHRESVGDVISALERIILRLPTVVDAVIK